MRRCAIRGEREVSFGCFVDYYLSQYLHRWSQEVFPERLWPSLATLPIVNRKIVVIHHIVADIVHIAFEKVFTFDLPNCPMFPLEIVLECLGRLNVSARK